MCCARQKRGESVALTMPWLGLKSDGRGRGTGKILPFGRVGTARPVRYTGNTNQLFDPSKFRPGDCDELQIAVPVGTNAITPVSVTPFTYPWEFLARISLGVVID